MPSFLKSNISLTDNIQLEFPKAFKTKENRKRSIKKNKLKYNVGCL